MRIRRGLSSRLLPCGCMTGIYETYDDEIVTILDARSPECAEQGHVAGKVVPGEASDPKSNPADPHEPSHD